MFGLGTQEIIILFLALLLIFGGKKLPELAKGLGKGIREFKKATKEIEDDFNVDDLDDKSKKPKE